MLSRTLSHLPYAMPLPYGNSVPRFRDLENTRSCLAQPRQAAGRVLRMKSSLGQDDRQDDAAQSIQPASQSARTTSRTAIIHL